MNTAQSDYDRLSKELFKAQEDLHEFSDSSSQSFTNRKATKRSFVEAALTLDPTLDPAQLWEIAELLGDRDNTQHAVIQGQFEPSDNLASMQADLSGKAAIDP